MAYTRLRFQKFQNLLTGLRFQRFQGFQRISIIIGTHLFTGISNFCVRLMVVLFLQSFALDSSEHVLPQVEVAQSNFVVSDVSFYRIYNRFLEIRHDVRWKRNVNLEGITFFKYDFKNFRVWRFFFTFQHRKHCILTQIFRFPIRNFFNHGKILKRKWTGEMDIILRFYWLCNDENGMNIAKKKFIIFGQLMIGTKSLWEKECLEPSFLELFLELLYPNRIPL